MNKPFTAGIQFILWRLRRKDLELLTTTEWLTKNLYLKWAYFSAFHPISDSFEELPFTSQGNLPLPAEPELAWAQLNLVEKPLEGNKADRYDLKRILGIGSKSAVTGSLSPSFLNGFR